MKRIFLLLLVIFIVMGVFTGCASKWQTFSDFFGEFEDVSDASGVKGILTGYKYEHRSIEEADNFLFDGVEVWDVEWSGSIFVAGDDIGATIRKSFDDESDRDQFYEEVLEQLTSEYGEGTEGTLETGTSYIGWEGEDWKLAVMMSTLQDLPIVSVTYSATTD